MFKISIKVLWEHSHAHTHTLLHMQTHKEVHMHAHIHTHARVCVHACTHTQSHKSCTHNTYKMNITLKTVWTTTKDLHQEEEEKELLLKRV